MKRCSKCGQEKALECFGKKRCQKDGYRTICKECHHKSQKKRPEFTDRDQERERNWEKKQRDSLSDLWVKKSILIASKGKIKTKQITPEMIQRQRGKLLEWRKKQAERKAYLSANPPIPKELTRVCIICGKNYDVKGKSLFCGDDCRNKDSLNKYYANQDSILSDRRKEYWETREPKKPFECKECGKIVIPKYENSNSKRKDFCSDKCMNKYGNRNRHLIERVRKHNNYYESVNPLKVFMRDGWRCQLCGKQLKKKDRGKIIDKAPELDHIIPLSKGGSHSYQNTQCACRKCNGEKNNNEIGQLRLFA